MYPPVSMDHSFEVYARFTVVPHTYAQSLAAPQMMPSPFPRPEFRKSFHPSPGLWRDPAVPTHARTQAPLQTLYNTDHFRDVPPPPPPPRPTTATPPAGELARGCPLPVLRPPLHGLKPAAPAVVAAFCGGDNLRGWLPCWQSFCPFSYIIVYCNLVLNTPLQYNLLLSCSVNSCFLQRVFLRNWRVKMACTSAHGHMWLCTATLSLQPPPQLLSAYQISV